MKIRKVGSAASIRSRDLGTLVRALPVLLAIQQLSPKGLHPPWLEAVSVYALAIWTTTLVPPSFAPLQDVPALPAFLPACDGQLQQDLSDGAGWFLPHVRIINVRVVESYPASRRVVVLLSLPRNPCSARRSLDAFLRAPASWHPKGKFLRRPELAVPLPEWRRSACPLARGTAPAFSYPIYPMGNQGLAREEFHPQRRCAFV